MFTVLVAGIPRSGSTWLFNASKTLLSLSHDDVQSAWLDDYRSVGNCSAEVVKIHHPNSTWLQRATVVLSSYRDLRDIASSMHSMGWAKSNQDMIDGATVARKMHDFWALSATLDIAYEAISLKPTEAMIAVATALGMNLPEDEAELLVRAVPQKAGAVGKAGYDEETLLHPEHVTNGRAGRWREDLNRDVAEAIWAQHGDWLEAHAYARI